MKKGDRYEGDPPHEESQQESIPEVDYNFNNKKYTRQLSIICLKRDHYHYYYLLLPT